MTLQTVLSAVLVLIGVLVLMTGGVRLLKIVLMRSPAGGTRTLLLQESLALDPRRRLHLIKCGNRQVVVLTGGGSDVVIGWLPET